MSLLIDKTRPHELSALTFHVETNNLLQKISQSPDFPHLLLFGPSGSGRKTRALCILREIFGLGADKVRTETKTLKTAGGTSFTVEVTTSSFHIEVSPGELGGNRDAILIQTLIKEAAQTPPPVVSEKTRGFKVVVIHDADTLSKQAQAGLRRTMEKYISSCRIILIAENFSRLIPPIRSRCLCIRVPRPETQEIAQTLANVASDENIKNINVNEISEASGRDLRRALLLLDVARVAGHARLNKFPWEAYVEEIGRDIVTEQTPRVLLLVRNKFYDLLGSGIPADVIFSKLARALPARQDLLEIAAEFEHSAKLGSKAIFHLEAYVAGVMNALRQ
jgi:replication factor C subunit 3/5